MASKDSINELRNARKKKEEGKSTTAWQATLPAAAGRSSIDELREQRKQRSNGSSGQSTGTNRNNQSTQRKTTSPTTNKPTAWAESRSKFFSDFKQASASTTPKRVTNGTPTSTSSGTPATGYTVIRKTDMLGNAEIEVNGERVLVPTYWFDSRGEKHDMSFYEAIKRFFERRNPNWWSLNHKVSPDIPTPTNAPNQTKPTTHTHSGSFGSFGGSGKPNVTGQTTVQSGATTTVPFGSVEEYLANRNKSIDEEIAQHKAELEAMGYYNPLLDMYFKNETRNGGTIAMPAADKDFIARYKELENRITLLEREKIKNEKTLRWNTYKNDMQSADLEEYAQKGAAIANPSATDVAKTTDILGGLWHWNDFDSDAYESIQNKVAFIRDNWDSLNSTAQAYITSVGGDKYLHLKEEEAKLYYAYLAKEQEGLLPTGTADAYLDYMQETLNSRKGTKKGVKDFEDIYDLPPVLRELAEGKYGFDTSVESFMTGTMEAIGKATGLKDDVSPTTVQQYAGQYVRENSSKAGQVVYDIGGVAGNMAIPSLLTLGASGAAQAAGATAKTVQTVSAAVMGTAVGTSAAGNAYVQALSEGYTEDEAWSYAQGVGVSEGALSAVLASVGGKVPAVLKTKANAIHSAVGRFFANLGIGVSGEVVEEELQLFIEPAIRSVVFNEEYDAPTLEEALYTALITAASTGMFELPGAMGSAFDKSGVPVTETAETPSADPVSPIDLEDENDTDKETPKPVVPTTEEPAPTQVEPLDVEGVDTQEDAILDAAREVTAQKQEVAETTDAKPSELDVNDEAKTTESAYRRFTGYGENGIKMFAEEVGRKGADGITVKTEMDAPYHAGRFGVGKDKVDLSTPIAQQAYNMGEMDRILDTARDKKAAEEASVWGKEAGLIKNDYSKSLPLSKRILFDEFAKQQGTKIVMRDRIYTDNQGGEANGRITSDGVIEVSMNADNPLGVVVTHEGVHNAKRNAPEQWEAFRDFAVKVMYGAYKPGSKDAIVRMREGYYRASNGDVILDSVEAAEEVATHFAERIMSGDVATLQEFVDAARVALEREDASVENTTETTEKSSFRKFLESFLEWVQDKIVKLESLLKKPSIKNNSIARADLEITIENLERGKEMLKSLFAESAKTVHAKREAGMTFSETVSEDGTVVVTNKNGDPVAMMTEEGSAQLSLKTWEDGGRDALVKWLDKRVKNKQITEAEANDIVKQMDEFHDICEQFVDKYAPFGAWSQAEVVKGLNGKPAFSVVKANGEYKMNLDFSLVCKKRRTLDAVFGEMIRRGIMDDVVLEEADIVRINDIIRTSGFETACALCFVDSKRYRQAMVADNFVNKYNELVEMLLPKNGDASAHYFNYVGMAKENAGRGLHTLTDAEVASGIKKLKQVMKENGDKTVPHKIAKHLLAHPEDRKFVRRSDFMNTDGFEEVSIKNPEIMKLYNSSKGSGGPKAAFSDVQYLGEILSKTNFTPARAYAVGGVRIQSFSDYIPRLVFDYLQMIGDLSAKKLPAHAYTKEALFAMQFGMTGIKVNMSLVPAVVEGGVAPGLDANGDYVWFDGQSFGSDVNVKGSGKTGFDLAVKIQNANGYSANCGTIAVGISDQHILKMLDDPNIRMIIPYHKSSLNHIVAMMNNIHQYKDFTGTQNTRYADSGTKLDPKTHKDFNYNKALRRTGDAKKAADEYLAWCKKNNYIPKFDQFAWHENYYKLLEDFSTYDNGVAAPQGPVTMTFPKEGDAFGSMSQLIEQGLEEDALLEARREKNLPKIVDEIEGALKKQTTTESGKKSYSIKDTAAESGVRYSLVTKKETLDFLDGQPMVKVYRAMQELDGELYPPMAALIKGENGGKQLVGATKMGAWYQADERPELIKFEIPGKLIGKKSSRYMDASEMAANKSVLYGTKSPSDTITLRDGTRIKYGDLKYKYELDKGNDSSVPAAYNPYFHTSASPLNDQFSSAYNRPNIVVVEGYIPKSELTSGYKAQYAKDSVGETSWHAGPVASKLKGEKARRVFLSRWFKASRVVPVDEVARTVAATLDGEGVGVPWNVVTPSLREALEREGVSIDYSDVKMGTKLVSFEDTNKAYSLKGVRELEDAHKQAEINDLLRKELADVQKALAEQIEKTEKWKGELKRTKEQTVDKKSVDKLTRKVLREYNSDADETEISAQLKELGDALLRVNTDEGLASAKAKADEIARAIVEESRETYVDSYLDEIKKTIRGTRIFVPEWVRRSIPDYEHFRRRNFGRLRLTHTEGVPIDVFWNDMNGQFGEFFSEDEIVNSVDQLLKLEEIVESAAPLEFNPFGEGDAAAEVIDTLGYELMVKLLHDVDPTPPTFADKQYEKRKQAVKEAKAQVRETERERTRKRLADERAKARERLNRLLAEQKQKARERYEKKLSEANARHRKQMANASERRKAQDLRFKIERHVDKMSRKLRKPTKTQNIPMELHNVVKDVLAAINMESNFEWVVGSDGKRRRVQKGADPNSTPTKRTEAFIKLRKECEEIADKNIYGIEFDPNLLKLEDGARNMLQEIVDMYDTPISSMSVEQLDTVWRVLRAVERAVLDAGKILTNDFMREKYVDRLALANAFFDAAETRKTHTTSDRHWTMDLMDPYTYFSQFGQPGLDFYRMLRNAQDDYTVKKKEIADMVSKIVSAEKRAELEKDIHEFETQAGEKLILSKAHIMDMWLLNNRPQGKQHLLGGGIYQPTIKGKVKKGSSPTRLTELDLGKIFATLTEEDRKFAQEFRKITDKLAEWADKANVRVYGYEKFGDPNYWTINVNRKGTKQKVNTNPDNSRSVADMSAAKNTVPEARNAVDIFGMFETFDRHASDMLNFAAWLAPSKDAEQLFNIWIETESGELVNNEFKDMLDRVGGAKSSDYWMELMEDIENGIKGKQDTEIGGFVEQAIGKTRRAAIASNMRVVIQQPTAAARALAVIDPKYLAKGLVKGVTEGKGADKARKYSPTALRKFEGNFDIGTGVGSLADAFYKPESLKGKGLNVAKEGSLWAAGKADELTWGKLWNACEHQIAGTRKDLTVGSEEWYTAVKELFDDTIDQTQVVDGILQRSKIMRSGSALAKQLTAFKGEPLKTANMLMRSVNNWRHETDPKKRSAARKKAARSAFALTLNVVVNAVAQSIWDGIRDDDDEEKLLKRALNAFTGLHGDEETWRDFTTGIIFGNLVSGLNPLNYIPLASDVVSIFEGYDVNRPDAEAWSRFMQEVKNTIGALGEDGGKQKLGYSVTRLLTRAGYLFGSGSSNLLRDIESVVRSVQVETDSFVALYKTEKLKYDVVNNKSKFIGILYNAYAAGDTKAYNAIYNDLIKSGVSEKSIASGMETRMMKAEGVTKASELEERWVAPTKKKQYDKTMSPVKKSSLWKNASAKQQSAAENLARSLANGSNEEAAEKIKAGSAIGLTEDEYVLYQLALDMHDTPNSKGELGTHTAGEKASAILAVDGLTDAEMAYLFDGKYQDGKAYRADGAGLDMGEYLLYRIALDKAAKDLGVDTSSSKAKKEALKQFDFTAKEKNYLRKEK